MRGNRAYVLAGVAVHERDTAALQDALTASVEGCLPPELAGTGLELHAAEIFRPRNHTGSRWRGIHNGLDRQRVLTLALETLGGFDSAVLFAAVGNPADPDVDRLAYKT